MAKTNGATLKCPQEYIEVLRKALIGILALTCTFCSLLDERGQDKDLSKDVQPYSKFNQNGLNCEIRFSKELGSLETWAMIMTTNNMTKLYDESKCAWSDDIKFDELVDHGGAARFLVVYERDARSKDARNPVGFVHFRFTLQGEPVGVEAGEPALYVMDIQLEESVRRRGLGKHLMTVIENIARQQGMMHILFPVVKEDRRARSFVLEGLSGYVAEHLGA
ncbi:hypothetical protein GUITHDRAFT_136122 [Guillardia theta CCMP2712]|uniref:N-alpha-acetyltransferase 40 n=1 Tax=Guillardia theta (strain CCMP2712) TaxID=905079 RepID=L1JN05_GUITC|nr:hypothetical protein GUITHDRAFT_136122 [Guillardia theta CCMP2712]EKX49458.1 hypothetical protein GUITHDRAFT_136122 [Guillardia theta CCMP2712]|eukprot:XP_005836438.1 hypothetical protein GUITHDRAFT_136122 [Guillardia theta CCMP2712]